MKPSHHEVITAAKTTKAYQKIGYFIISVFFLLIAYLVFHSPPTIILVLLCMLIFQLFMNNLRHPHEEILREFAKINNWFYPVDTELHRVHGKRKRVRFYSTHLRLLDIDDIIQRVFSNNFTPMQAQPTGEVPRKTPCSKKFPTIKTAPIKPDFTDQTGIVMHTDQKIESAPATPLGLPVFPMMIDDPCLALQSQPLSEPVETYYDQSTVQPSEEGTVKTRTHYARVRSAKLREAAIKIHGRDCCTCGINFDKIYGKQLSRGYIEVHHLQRIAKGVRKTDPAKDLVTLCSNCHKMADRLAQKLKFPPSTIEDLRRLLFPPRSSE